MKKLRFLLFVTTIATVLLSACGAAVAAPSVREVAPKVDAVTVAFIGTIDSMAGDEWVINGNTVTVASDVVRDGPFHVGDQVKVEGVVNPEGSFAISRVESPTAADLSSLAPFGSTDNSNSNTNDVNFNDGNINDSNLNDVNSNGDNSNAASLNNANVNDDNGINANSNDDNSNSANSNDDHSLNNQNGNGADDNGGGSNSKDDSGLDDNSSKGGGGDDDGGSSNSNDD